MWHTRIAARALWQPRALLHHPRDTLKDLILAGHVITITSLPHLLYIHFKAVIYRNERSKSRLCHV